MVAKRKWVGVAVASCLAGVTSLTAVAEGCDDYPGTGATVEQDDDGPKFKATASAPVDFDSAEAVDFAMDEANLKAIAQLTEFISGLATNERSLESAAKKMNEQTKGQNGQNSAAALETTKALLKSYSVRAAGDIKGVIQLGDCYSPGLEVRVTVGVKPEFTAAADDLADSMAGKAPNSTSSRTSSRSNSEAGDDGNMPRSVPARSNTQGIRDF